MPALETLLDRLVDHGVDFVVIGGFAAVAHGVTLLTQDLDICCEFSAENLLRIQEALKDIHPQHRMTNPRRPLELTHRSCSGLKNLYLDTDEGQIDCLSEVKGVGRYGAVLAHSIEIDWGLKSCRVLDLDSLITAKEEMGRPRDLEAAMQLRAIREAQS